MVGTIPASARDFAEALHQAADRGERIFVEGNGSKRAMGGPLPEAAAQLSTRGLDQVLEFEPRDLTLSVGAGLPWRRLEEITAAQGLCVPLDPPHAAQATVGGVLATNGSGPRRRLYGSARDLVIGMEYATLDGHLCQSGGMVVKNVAGLDVQKLLIGSFGTLAVITSANFKLAPAPEASFTLVASHPQAQQAVDWRDKVLRGPLQPAAIDLLNPSAAAFCGLDAFCVLVRAEGPESVLARYRKELEDAERIEGAREAELWNAVREFVPRRLELAPATVVVRAGWPLPELGALLESTAAPLVARAGSGVACLAFPSLEDARAWLAAATSRPWSRVIEYAPAAVRATSDLWPGTDPGFALMRRLKEVFDPQGLLNPGRLYGKL
jgi:glycolate oxidase FAD binding subunit